MDIVERLRSDFSTRPLTHEDRLEVAAEIERLREALKEIVALPRQKRGSVSYAMAAIARSALQQKETE